MRVTIDEAIDMIHRDVDAREWLTAKKGSKKKFADPFGDCNSSDGVSENPKIPGKWKCFSCEKTFDALDALAVSIDSTYIPHTKGHPAWSEALRICCKRLGIEIERGDDRALMKDEYIQPARKSSLSPTGTAKAPEPPTAKPLNIKPEYWKKLHGAAVNLPYLTQERGIPAEVIARHPAEIGYSEHARPWGKHENKAVIFLTSPTSCVYRFLTPVKMGENVVKEATGTGMHKHLWHPAALDGGRPVFIVEGILDALSLETVGAEAVALQGTGVKALFAEIDRRKAAGQTIPPLVEALDADKAGRDNARNLQEAARARGVFIAEGVSVTGTNKDANDALRAEGAAFAERVKAATRDAEKSAAEQSTDREEATAMQEVPAAEQKPADLPSLPKGNGGIINPAAIGTGGLVFIAENEKAAAEITNAGGIAIGAGTQIALNFLFDELDKRKEAGQEIPAAFVDCLTSGDAGRAIVRDFIEPRCKLLGIKLIQAIPVFVSDGTGVQQRDALPELVDAAGKRFETLLEEEKEAERQAYAAETAAARAVNFFADTENVKPFSPTGFRDLDAILDGGFYSGLYIVGAISSLGKTTFILQVADYVAAHGQDVLYFSLEMSAYEIMGKSFSRLTHEIAERQHNKELARPIRDILTGSRRQRLSVEQNNAILQAADEYRKNAEHLHILESVGTKTAEDIRKDVERHHRLTGNWPLVIVDYLQILKAADPHMTDKQATDAAVLTLKQISRDYDIPVFCVSSFNRDNYFSPINMTAFKESGAVEYSADVLLGLQYYGMDLDRNESSEKSDKRRRRLDALRRARNEDSKAGRPVFIQARILKNRNGTKGDCFFKYFNRYNHYEDSNRDDAEEWKCIAEMSMHAEDERAKADRELLEDEEPGSTGKKKATGRKRGSKEDGSRRL